MSIPELLITMLEGNPHSNEKDIRSLWRTVISYSGLAGGMQTEDWGPHLPELLSLWLPKQAAVCQRYGTFLSFRGEKFKGLLMVVVIAQSMLLKPAAQLLAMYIKDAQHLQLADAIEGSPDLADAALAHLLGFCEHSYHQWQLDAGASARHAASSSGGSSRNKHSTSHSSESTGRGRNESRDTEESSCGANRGGTFSSSRGGGSSSSSSSNRRSMHSTTIPAHDAALHLLPDHEMVVVPEPVRALAAGHAKLVKQVLRASGPSTLLSGSIRVLLGSKQHSAAQQEEASSSATSSSSSAKQTAATPATLLPLLLEAVALLDDLKLQLVCLHLMAEAAREASRADVHSFLKQRGPLLLQVLWQLVLKTYRAEQQQQQQSSQEHDPVQDPLATASVQLLSRLVDCNDAGKVHLQYSSIELRKVTPVAFLWRLVLLLA